MEYYTATKKGKIVPFVTTCMEIEHQKLSKSEQCMDSFYTVQTKDKI